MLRLFSASSRRRFDRWSAPTELQPRCGGRRRRALSTTAAASGSPPPPSSSSSSRSPTLVAPCTVGDARHPDTYQRAFAALRALAPTATACGGGGGGGNVVLIT